MSEYFYVYENGSGSTWSKNVVPANCCKIYVDSKGQLCLSKVVPSSFDITGIKNLKVVKSSSLPRVLKALQGSKEITGKTP